MSPRINKAVIDRCAPVMALLKAILTRGEQAQCWIGVHGPVCLATIRHIIMQCFAALYKA